MKVQKKNFKTILKENKKQIFTIGVIILSLVSMGLFINYLFPDSQGFTRNVLYIKDSQSGYYIIDDEIKAPFYSRSNIYFYGLGALTINGQSAEWQIDDIVLNLTVLYPEVKISAIEGKVYQSTSVYDVTYGINIEPIQKGINRVVSVLYPYNITKYRPTYNEISHEVDVNNNFKGWVINNTDYIIIPIKGKQYFYDYSTTHQKVPFIINDLNYHGIQSSTHRIMFRLNETEQPEFIYSYGTNIRYNSLSVGDFSTIQSLEWNEIQDYQIFSNDNELDIPSKSTTISSTPPSSFGLNHPFLFFNESQKADLQDKIDGTIPGPWQFWHSTIGPWSSQLERAFKAYLEDDVPTINNIILELLNMESTLEPFRQNLERGTKIIDYIVTYDILYNYMTPTQRDTFEQMAFRMTYPSADSIINNVCPNNNHKLVSLCAYGVLGLVLNNASMIQLMQNQIDHYLNKLTSRGGIGFEGPSYAEYTYKYATRFMYALKNIGGYNYYHDPNFIDVLNYTLRSRCPDGTHALFEDAHAGVTISGLVLQSISQVQDEYPILASNLRWYAEQYGYNNIWQSGIFYNIVMFNETGSSTEPDSGFDGSFIYFEGGIAGLGSGQKNNDTMLVISNKPYYQSHAHYDENSLEFWAYGKKFLTNAGYPNYGADGHSYALSTSSNNAITIGNHPQYLIQSDGFKLFHYSENLQVIESPCYLSYEHSISFAHFPWIQIFSFVFVLSLIQTWLKCKNMLRNEERLYNKYIETRISRIHQVESNYNRIKRVNSILWLLASYIQCIGFIMLFTRLKSYIMKGISHLEYYPEQKLQFQTYFGYLILVLSLITVLIVCFRTAKRSNFFNRIRNISNSTPDPTNKEFRIEINKQIFLSMFLIFSLIWALLLNVIIYQGLFQLLINFFTEGSTIQNFLSQAIGFILILWYFMFLVIIIRYLLFLCITPSNESLKRIIKRDINQIIGIALFILVGVFVGQHIPIDLLH